MSGLDNDARIAVEGNTDSIINDAKKAEEAFTLLLSSQRIEPDLETILSFIIGYLYGIVTEIYVFKHQRILESEEIIELNNLLKRRAGKIREAFMGTRIAS
jgi:hypothetical protein